MLQRKSPIFRKLSFSGRTVFWVDFIPLSCDDGEMRHVRFAEHIKQKVLRVDHPLTNYFGKNKMHQDYARNP